MYTRIKDNLFVKIINVGSVYGYNENNNFGIINLIIVNFVNKKGVDYYYSTHSKRLKNIIYIDHLVREIISQMKINKYKNFFEKDILGDLINMNDLIDYLHKLFPAVKVKYIKKSNQSFMYYYKNILNISIIDKKKIDTIIKKYKKNIDE